MTHEEIIDSIINNTPLPDDNSDRPLAEGWVKVVDVDCKVENSEKCENGVQRVDEVFEDVGLRFI